MSPANVHGSCLCGAVQVEVARFMGDVTGCHCSQCRKQTGHHVAAVNVKRDELTVTGEHSLRWYAASADAKRGFCGTCGSVLFWRANDADHVALMAGCLDAPTGLRTRAHIFTADQGDYYVLNDGLPQHPQSD